jgi:hypothetical protein
MQDKMVLSEANNRLQFKAVYESAVDGIPFDTALGMAPETNASNRIVL